MAYDGLVSMGGPMSVNDDSGEMRSNLRAQCLSKIERLKEDDNIEVK